MLAPLLIGVAVLAGSGDTTHIVYRERPGHTRADPDTPPDLAPRCAAVSVAALLGGFTTGLG